MSISVVLALYPLSARPSVKLALADLSHPTPSKRKVLLDHQGLDGQLSIMSSAGAFHGHEANRHLPLRQFLVGLATESVVTGKHAFYKLNRHLKFALHFVEYRFQARVFAGSAEFGDESVKLVPLGHWHLDVAVNSVFGVSTHGASGLHSDDSSPV